MEMTVTQWDDMLYIIEFINGVAETFLIYVILTGYVRTAQTDQVVT